GWEKAFGCLSRPKAELPGYSRTFNKASVRNWGTKQFPCPTLNLVASSASCCGIAFEFPDESKQRIMLYLKGREGKCFVFPTLPIKLHDGAKMEAVVSLYHGPNILAGEGGAQIIKMAIEARGREGSCTRYVEGIAEQLRHLGISDPVVDEVFDALG